MTQNQAAIVQINCAQSLEEAPFALVNGMKQIIQPAQQRLLESQIRQLLQPANLQDQIRVARPALFLLQVISMGLLLPSYLLVHPILLLLDSAIYQSQVNERNDSGSSACTTISVLMSKLNLMNLIPAVIEDNQISEAFVEVFKVAMTEGNKLQDNLEGQLNKKELCVYEVLRHSNLCLKIEHEDVFTQNNIDAMKNKIKSIVEEKKTAACVVVLPKEVSVFVLFNADGSAIIADSHSRNPHRGFVIYFPSTSSTHVVSCLNWILVKCFNGSFLEKGAKLN